MKKNKKTDSYEIAKQIVSELGIGEVKTIDMPLSIKMFRYYLTTEAQKQGKKFTTKSDKGKLHVGRIKKEASFWDKVQK